MKNPTILLVDDEPELLEILASVLQNEYNIVIANDYVEALDRLKDSSVNGVITDLNIPLGSGLELIQHVTLNYPLIPTTLITGETCGTVLKEAETLGALKCISKPFNFKKLLQTAEELVERNKENTSDKAQGSAS